MIERQNIKKDRPLAPKYRVRRAEGASNPKRFGVAAKGKRIYIRTFGCQMNTRDSEALLGLFLEKGYVAAQSEKEADVILVNTCSVRGHAEQRAISYLGSLKKVTSRKPQVTSKKRSTQYAVRGTKIIGLIGCMAKNRGEELFKKMRHIDLICGPANFAKIPHYIKRIKDKGERIKDLDDEVREEKLYSASFRVEDDHAQVVISTGCSNYCSYCVVPYVRGPLRLRKPKDIIDEVKRNIDLGIKNITLLGQNVNDYRFLRIKDEGKRKKEIIDFVDLLKMVDNIEGIQELSFITSQPRNTTKELFEVMAGSDKIKKHLHLPVQSGSNRILKLMKRGYTREKYLQLVDNYKKIVNGSLGTDIIVGFPTESEADFLETKDIIEKVRFKNAYIFKYSSRRQAESVKLSDDVLMPVKIKRHKILLDLQKEIALAKV